MNRLSQFNNNFKRLLPFMKPYKFSWIFAVLCIFGATALSSLSPVVEGLILTKLTENSSHILKDISGAAVDFKYILSVLILLLIIYLSNTVIVCLSNWFLTNSIQNTIRDLRTAIMDKIRKLPVSYFDTNSYGDVLSRMTNDIDIVSQAFQQSFSQVITAILSIVLAFSMMFSINIKMSLLALLIIPSSILITKFIVLKSQGLFENQQEAIGKLNSAVEEIYTGFNEIKLYGKEEVSVNEFEVINDSLCRNGFKAQFVSSIMSPLISLTSYLGIAVMIFLGSIFAIGGVLTIGNMQAFIRYICRINEPLSQATQLSTSIQSAFAAIERVFNILDEKEESLDSKNPIKLDKVRGNVTFENVKFGYSKDKILIKDLSVNIKSGHIVAIVGPTGAGKTTLINLLMRFYDVNDGSIKIDGVDIRDMSREYLRSNFGMVLQDTWLFNGTIADNIEYGRFNASIDEIIEAAKIANVHQFIKSLPDGYNMFLNEESSNISQGEKQLLTIARAIISDPAILILDEATSSIDTRVEVILQNAMNNIMKGRTSFVIAHRLSTIKNADLILVIDDGDIIEQGNHNELIAKGGLYKKLYNSQFASCN